MRVCKFLAILLAVLAIAAADAAAVEKKLTFEWDPNTEPYLTGYHLYYSIDQQGGPYEGPIETFGKVTTGSTVIEINPGETFYFVLRAYTSEISPSVESGNSNEVFFRLDPSDPGNYVLAPPAFRLKSAETVSSSR